MTNASWFAALRRLLGDAAEPSLPARRRAGKSRSAPAWEPEILERRDLLTVSAVLSGGILTLQGDAAPNVASVSLSGGSIQAKITGSSTAAGTAANVTVTKSFAAHQVKRIVFHGLGGNDSFVHSTALPSTANGGDGNDTLTGGSGADRMFGGAGNDTLTGGSGNDLLEGGAGDDVLLGGLGDDVFAFAGKLLGSDRLGDTGGIDALDFRGFAAGGLRLDLALTGRQTVETGDLLLKLDSAAAFENVFGTEFADVVKGNALANTLLGHGGNDTLYGFAGNDTIAGGAGHDVIYGGTGDDLLSGEAGNDRIFGDDGHDQLGGDDGDDSLSGGGGDDRLRGGAGADTFVGGTGWDHYHDTFQLFVDGVSLSDIRQAEAPVCTILAALAETIGLRNWADAIRAAGTDQYEVRLYDTAGKLYWEKVSFDGTWSDQDAAPAKNAAGTVYEAWTILVQRAALERNGIDWNRPYAAWSTHWTRTTTGLEALLGGRATTAYPAGTTAAQLDGWVAMQSVTAGTKASGTTDGIVSSHAYALLDVYRSGSTWYVVLFNPWGTDGAKGALTGTNDGLVTLTWARFVADFDVIARV